MGGYLMLKLADEGVIYARVSSAKQVAQGNGIPSQISACQFFAKEHDIKIIRIFKEPAKSGKTLERPSLKELINFLEERKKLIYVIVDDLDRLTREKEHYYPLKEIITLNKGIPIDIKGHINNDDDPYKGFLEHSMVGFADLWRRVNKARVMERQAERLKAGYWVFPTPIGYIHDENKELEINSISILNISGEVVKTITENTNSIDVSNLTNGIYLLQIKTDNGLVSKKFIKK